MSNFKLFLDNFLIYGVGSIINKLVPFLMLPIVIRLMPNSSYFGLSDITNTLVVFGVGFTTMGMYDAAFRTFFDKKDKKFQKTVCSTTLFFILGTSILVSGLLFFLDIFIAEVFFGSNEYLILVYFALVSILTSSISNILTIPSRVENKRVIFLSVNFISSIISYSISIFLLMQGYYLIALPVATLFSSLTIGIIFFIINKKWFHFNLFKFYLLKQMLVIALPMVPAFFLYWVLGSCDRIMIVHFIGNEAVGMYVAGAKLASASQLIYLAFSFSWQYFAFSTMNEKNQVKNNSLMFEYLGIISFIATSFVCALAHNIVSIFYPQDYQYAYIVMPYLFLIPLLLMLYEIIENQFYIIKKTWPCTIFLLCAVFINLIFNYFFIPIYGIVGAAISSLCGYIVLIGISMIVAYRMNLFIIKTRFLVSFLLLISELIIWQIFSNEIFSVFINRMIFVTIIISCMMICYSDEILFLFNKIRIKSRKL